MREVIQVKRLLLETCKFQYVKYSMLQDITANAKRGFVNFIKDLLKIWIAVEDYTNIHCIYQHMYASNYTSASHN